MTVDNGANSMTPGNEALPVQRSQNVPQLCAADAQYFGQHILTGEALAVGIFTVLHGGQQVGPDGFGLGRLTAHSVHLILKIDTTYKGRTYCIGFGPAPQ